MLIIKSWSFISSQLVFRSLENTHLPFCLLLIPCCESYLSTQMKQNELGSYLCILGLKLRTSSLKLIFHPSSIQAFSYTDSPKSSFYHYTSNPLDSTDVRYAVYINASTNHSLATKNPCFKKKKHLHF